MDFESDALRFDAVELLKKFQTYAANSDIVVFSDYAKGTLRDVQKLIECARSFDLAILVDPKGADFSRYRSVCAHELAGINSRG